MADEEVTDTAVDSGDNSEATTETTQTEETTVDAAMDTITPVAAKGDAKEDVKPDWPDDWRDKLANGDEKTRKRLDRFQSPADVLKSWQALEQKMSSGDVKATLPEGATDEQVAEYRKANGIPEKPEGYLENLPNGLVIGEEDKDLVSSYIERVHGKNADPAVVAETLDWYYAMQQKQADEQSQSDKEFARQYEDELRAEWGNEYRSNINSVHALLDAAPPVDGDSSFKELLLGSRLSDGTPVGDHPAMLKWLARIASDQNPAGFIAPSDGASQIESVKTEIAEIEKVMREDRARYNKDTKMQERLRVLYEAEAKLSA